MNRSNRWSRISEAMQYLHIQNDSNQYLSCGIYEIYSWCNDQKLWEVFGDVFLKRKHGSHGTENHMMSKNISYMCEFFSLLWSHQYFLGSPNIRNQIFCLQHHWVKIMCIAGVFIWTTNLIELSESSILLYMDTYYINKRSLFWTCCIVSFVNRCTSIGKRIFSTLGNHFGASSMPLLNRISRSVSECFVMSTFILNLIRKFKPYFDCCFMLSWINPRHAIATSYIQS